MIPRLHVVTDDATLSAPGFTRAAQAVLQEGGSAMVLHVRGPRTSGARIFDVARTLRGPALHAGALLLVNDRVDVALVLGLGAHLRGGSLPPARARGILGPSAVLGLSVRDVRTARESLRGRPDYLIVGTIFPSVSHPGRAASGVELIADVATAVDVPVLGIGGMTLDRVPDVRAAGAHGVAVLSGIWKAPRPASAVGAYIEVLDGQASEPGPETRE